MVFISDEDEKIFDSILFRLSFVKWKFKFNLKINLNKYYES